MADKTKKRDISDSEFEIMEVLWKSDEAVTAQDVCDALAEKNWKYSTVATFLGRLYEKGCVDHEKRGKFYYYTPILDEEEYKMSKTKTFLGRLYDGSVKNLVAALFNNKELSAKDVEEIKSMFDLKNGKED